MFRLSNTPLLSIKKIYNSKTYLSFGTPDKTHPFPRTAKTSPQSGRSMTEMLGVLAIAGILSVGGVYAFRTAMDRHWANELVYEANKLAMVAASQAALGNTTFSLGEFSFNKIGGGTFSAEVKKWESEFGIIVNHVNQAVCQNLISLFGDNNQIKAITTTRNPYAALTADKCTQDNNLIFIYSTDMSTQANTNTCARFEPTICTTKCTDVDGMATYTYAAEGTLCNHGTCDAYGACVCEAGYAGDNCDTANPNTPCNLNTPCPEGSYCHYNGFVYSEDINTALAGKSGTCKKINGITRYVEGLGTIRVGNEQTNWFNAYIWCQAQGMRLIPRGGNGMQCYINNSANLQESVEGSGYCCDKNKYCYYSGNNNRWVNREENGLFSPVIVRFLQVVGREGVYHSTSANDRSSYSFNLSAGNTGRGMKAYNGYPLCFAR